MANLLRARLQRIRDDARAVLVAMMAELGPRYVPYACHVLRASLPDKGFTAHVIGYTLHAVLEAVVQVGRGGRTRVCGCAGCGPVDQACGMLPGVRWGVGGADRRGLSPCCTQGEGHHQ